MHRITRHITVLVMSLCLALLTGLNFFMHLPESPATTVSTAQISGEDPVPVPVEEKAPETSHAASVEAFLNDSPAWDLSAFNRQVLHRLHTAEKLQLADLWLSSPPPENMA